MYVMLQHKESTTHTHDPSTHAHTYEQLNTKELLNRAAHQIPKLEIKNTFQV